MTSSGTLLALAHHDAPDRAQRTLTFEERALYQPAIEEVYFGAGSEREQITHTGPRSTHKFMPSWNPDF
jgi:hypothetical protein